VVDALRVHKKSQRVQELAAENWEKSNLVFSRPDGTPMNRGQLMWAVRSLCKDAGIPIISPNELRHSAATLLVEAGVSMQSAADLLGHTNTRMLEKHYRHKRLAVDVTEGMNRMLG
jgi:integrase